VFFAPIAYGSDRADVGFFDRVAALGRARQQRNGCLDVWGERQSRQDLRHVGDGHLTKPGQFHYIGENAVRDQLIAVDRQYLQL